MTENKPGAADTEQAVIPPMAPVKGGVIPYLCVNGAIKAAEFYTRAFGADQVGLNPPDEQGRTMHVHLYVNNGSVMLSDGYPEHGCPWEKAQGYTLHLYVKDIDSWWERAVAAGCEIVLPLQDMFWGDRYGQVRDPFGVLWSMGEPEQ